MLSKVYYSSVLCSYVLCLFSILSLFPHFTLFLVFILYSYVCFCIINYFLWSFFLNVSKILQPSQLLLPFLVSSWIYLKAQASIALTFNLYLFHIRRLTLSFCITSFWISCFPMCIVYSTTFTISSLPV